LGGATKYMGATMTQQHDQSAKDRQRAEFERRHESFVREDKDWIMYGYDAGYQAALSHAAQAKPVVPDGWVFYTADFSRVAAGTCIRGSVTLTRDTAEYMKWMKLTEEEREYIPLYISGHGLTVQEAIECAAKYALLADAPKEITK
jgi:hypothetical protein